MVTSEEPKKATVRRANLLLGAFLGMSMTVVGAGISFGVQGVLARNLGTEGYGIYAFVMSMVGLVVLLAKVEMENASAKYLGAYLGNGQRSLALGFLRFSQRTVFLASATIGVACAIAILAWPTIDPALSTGLLIGCVTLPLLAQTAYLGGVLQGLHRVVASQFPVLVLRPALFGGVLIALLLLNGGFTPEAALGANAITLFVAVLVQGVLVSRAIGPTSLEMQFRREEWIRTAVGLLGVSSAQYVLSGQSDVILAGLLLGKADAGRYAAANLLIVALSTAMNAFAFVGAPRLAEYLYSKDRAAAQQLLDQTKRGGLLVTLPLLVVLVGSGRLVLRFLGPDFAASYPIMVILSLAVLQGAAGGAMSGFVMTMAGRERQAAVFTWASAFLYLALAYVLAPRFGPEGIALATLVSVTARNLVTALYIRRNFGLRVFF